MQRADWVKLSAMNLLLVAIILFPFLPGPPNGLVIVLSALGQALGFLGLILLPVAMIWTGLEIHRQVKSRTTNVYQGFSYGYSIACLVICTLIYALFVLALSGEGIWAALTALSAGFLFFILALRGINRTQKRPARKFNIVPLYFLTLPVVALLTRLFLLAPVSGLSRDYAIERSKELITVIEDYKTREGEYPETLAVLKEAGKKIPGPFVMGIHRFRYNKINGQYSLSFSQWLDLGSLEEIVVYDKTDLAGNLTGPYAAYDYSFDLCRIKGAFAKGNTGHSNWKYYHCD